MIIDILIRHITYTPLRHYCHDTPYAEDAIISTLLLFAIDIISHYADDIDIIDIDAMIILIDAFIISY
jgi:hypothetical protein